MINTSSIPVIVTTPNDLAVILRPWIEAALEEAIARVVDQIGNDDRMVKYEEARRITGLGKTQFSRAVNDGTIPHYPNGVRGKLFRISDLRRFQGYQPKTEAQQRFEDELSNRK